MTDTFDPHSNTLLLAEGMQQAELIVNRAIQCISALCNISVISGLTVNGNTPSSTNDGDVFFTGTAAASPWDPTQDSVFAQNIGGEWFYTPAQEGWIAYDRSTNKYYRFTSATVKVEIALSATISKSITILSPGAAENVTIWETQRAITVTRLRSVLVSGVTSVTWNIRHHPTRNTGSPNNVMSANLATTSATTGDTVTTFAGGDPTIPAGSWVWLITSAVTGTGGSIGVTIDYTED